MIIIEGPDGVGKTTLVKKLVGALAYAEPGSTVEVRHKGPPSQHPLVEYEDDLLGYNPRHQHHIICDRWHVGEFVYPQVLNRDTRADTAVRRHIELFLKSRGAILVTLTDDVDAITGRLTSRGDEYIAPHHLPAILTGYAHYFGDTTLPALGHRGIDFSDGFIDLVIDTARTYTISSVDIAAYVTYAGGPRPKTVLLGDVRHALTKNHADKRDIIWSEPALTRHYGPAFGPYLGTSGHFLLSSITEELWHTGIGLLNACDVDNAYDAIATLRWQASSKLRVVALGTNAWRRVHQLWPELTRDPAEHPFTLGAVPHPQYVRRFHNKHGAEYGEVITDASRGHNNLDWRPGAPVIPLVR